MKAILGKKIGMTRVFDQDGKAQNVTIVEAGPCSITQIKTKNKDGYEAIQICFGVDNEKHIKKPQIGHLKKSKTNSKNLKEIRDFNLSDETGDDKVSLEIGNKISVDIFKIGDKVNIQGISKGKGFSGTVKRHHFSRGPETHGSHNIRQPGSIGASSFPSRVFKGKRMSGHMGAKKVTVKKIEIIDIILEKNLLLLKGSVPGANKSQVLIKL